MFPPKTRADVGMVQCVPARYGKTIWWKNRKNKEEGRSMQNPGHLHALTLNKLSPSIHLPTFCRACSLATIPFLCLHIIVQLYM